MLALSRGTKYNGSRSIIILDVGARGSQRLARNPRIYGVDDAGMRARMEVDVRGWREVPD